MAYSEGRNRNLYPGRAGYPVRRARIKVPPRMLRAGDMVRRAPRRGPWLYAFLGLLLVMLVIPTVALGGGAVYYVNTAASLQGRLDKLASYHERAFQTSRIFDRNGTLLYEFVNAGRRDPVKLDQVADLLKDATIAVEDKTFYENVGVDYLGIVKAAYRNFMSGEEVSGASTITQQLIKLVVLSQDERGYENRYRRKLTEIILAQQLSDEYTKDQILELYLNEIPYGNLAYGIQAAARSYFGKNASDLNLNEASLLAGLPQSPTVYNPIEFLKNGVLKGVQLKRGWLNPSARLPGDITPPRARQVAVLRQMVLSGKTTEPAARNAIAQDLQFAEQTVAINAPHFVFYVKQVLEQDPLIRPLLANEGGLNITTTLDLSVQGIAQREAARRIEELEREQRNIHNAAVVVMRPGTSEILAMVGSVDYNRTRATTTPGEEGNVLDGNVNVTTRERQPGSALKPFTYLSALAQNKLNAGSILWDVETKFPIKLGADKKNLNDPQFWYGPKNFTQKWYGPIRMRESLANSLNMPAVKTLKRAGVKETIDLLHRAGINGLRQPPEYYGLALTLGGGEVTPLDLTTAYNTMASNGEYIPATPILKITDRAGNELPFKAGERRQAVDPKYVAIVRDFMGDNEARTPLFGRENPLNPSRPARAKTGTTEDFRDAWTVGFTPYVTVGVWTGNNNNEKTDRVESVQAGGVIWNRIMEAFFKDPALDRLLRGPNLSVPLDFPSPETLGLEKRKICQVGGRFGQRTEEWFVPGQDSGATDSADGKDDCDMYKTVTAVQEPNGSLCMPAKGVKYSGRLLTFRVWSLPPSNDEEMVVEPKWEGGTLEGSPIPVAPDRPCGDALAVGPAEPERETSGVAQSQPAQSQSRAVEPVQSQPRAVQPAQSQPQAVQPVQPRPRAVQPTPTRPRAVQPAQQSQPRAVQPTQPRRRAAAQPTPRPARPTPRPAQVEQQPAPQPQQQPAPQPEPQPAPPPPPEPPVARIPSMVGLGENQAKSVLAGLGITNVVVDYQGPDRLGALYDQTPAYVVVSHSPGPGARAEPGMTVVLGIRAP